MDNTLFRLLGNGELIAATRALALQSCVVEADLLQHLAELDERKLYLDFACASMFAFCTDELKFSEGVAYVRITVARAARRFPAILDSVRAGRVHLAGIRLLVPHMTAENHASLLEQASGKTKAQVLRLVAELAPRPPVPTVIRKMTSASPAPAEGAAPRAVTPLAQETYKVQFTGSRSFCEKLGAARDLMRHRVPDGDLAAILERALDVLIEQTKKERFGVGRKGRDTPAGSSRDTPSGSCRDTPAGSSRHVPAGSSRHVPAAISRTVYERDGGRCAFVDARGKRCGETGGLELDHVDGFARTREHDVDKLRLLCRAHNQHAADQMYGRDFMDRKRRARPGSSSIPDPSVTSRTPPRPSHSETPG